MDGNKRASWFGLVVAIISFLIIIINGASGSSLTGFTYSSFQQGVICNASHYPVHPKSLSDLQNIVLSALKANATLKPIGSLHSVTDIICTEGIPVIMHAINHFKFDPVSKQATVGAGAKLQILLNGLHKAGRTIYGIPSYQDITVGGAVATGAHGTNIINPATISDQMVRVVFVDGLGNVVNSTEPGVLNAFRANFGLLGIVYEVTLTTIPQFKLHMRHYPQPDTILFQYNKLVRLAEFSERLQFFWFPSTKDVIVSVGNRLPISSQGNCSVQLIPESPRPIVAMFSGPLEIFQETRNHAGYFAMETYNKLSLFRPMPAKLPFYVTNSNTFCSPAIGYSHRMSSNGCTECIWSHGKASLFHFEFVAIIPLTEFPGAVRSIRNILRKYPMEFPLNGIYIRFLSASDGLLTINSGRVSVAIEWVLVPRKDRFREPMLGLSSSQAIMQALVFEHGGRPHWGKCGALYSLQPILLKAYPGLPQFMGYMEKFDPHGVFMNDFGRRLRFGYRKTSLDSYANHCGLVDNCICETDTDCGDGTQRSYICGTIDKYRVCKEREMFSFL